MTATRTVTFLLVVSLLLFAACETDLPPLPDDPPAPGDEGGTNIAGQAIGTTDERFSEPHFGLAPNPAEIPTRLTITSNDTIIWSSGHVSIDAGVWSEFSLAGERVQNTNWLRAGAQAEIPLDETTTASENNYAIIYSCNLQNNQWNCRENKWQMKQFTTETSCEEGEIYNNSICTNGELIPLPETPEGPETVNGPDNPPTTNTSYSDRCVMSAEFECINFRIQEHAGAASTLYVELRNVHSAPVAIHEFSVMSEGTATNCIEGNTNDLEEKSIVIEPTYTHQITCDQIPPKDSSTGIYNLEIEGEYTIFGSPETVFSFGGSIRAQATRNETTQTHYTCGDLVGDVTGDGRITQADADAVLKISTEQATIDSIHCADVNNDGRVNSRDASLILQYVQGEEVDRVGTVDTSRFVQGIPLNDHESDVTVELYADYRSQFSRDVNEIIELVVEEEQVKWEVYMTNFIERPRQGYHAKTMLCLQEYVPEGIRAVHDVLMETNISWLDEYDENHVTLAAQTDSPLAFQRCVREGEGEELLSEHRKHFEAKGVRAEPTIIIKNDHSETRIEGRTTQEVLRNTIQDKIQNQGTYECGSMVGDVTGDGIISQEDADAILRITTGQARVTDNACADVNKDGRVNSRDASLIMQYLRGEDIEHIGTTFS